MIRTKNEAACLPSVLQAVGRQRRRCDEIIVVDSGSTDGTPEIAESFGARLIHIDPGAFTFGYALNVGISASTGDAVVILSGHAVPADDSWLEHLVSPLSMAAVAGCYGRQVPAADCHPWERLNLHRCYQDRPRVQDHDPTFSNANSAVARRAWQEVPFREDLPGSEDHAWAAAVQARRYQIRYVPAAPVLHSHNEGLRSLYRRMRREREGLIAAGLRSPQCSLARVLAGSLRATVVDVITLARHDAPVRAIAGAPPRRLAQALGAYTAHREWRVE